LLHDTVPESATSRRHAVSSVRKVATACTAYPPHSTPSSSTIIAEYPSPPPEPPNASRSASLPDKAFPAASVSAPNAAATTIAATLQLTTAPRCTRTAKPIRLGKNPDAAGTGPPRRNDALPRSRLYRSTAATTTRSTATPSETSSGHHRVSPTARASPAQPSGDSQVSGLSSTAPAPRSRYDTTSTPRPIVYTPRTRSTSWEHTAAIPAKTSPNTPSDAAYTVASAPSTPAATRPPASAAHVSTNDTVVTSTADTNGVPRPIRPANIMSRRPVSSSRRVIPAIKLIPIIGTANDAMKPNSFAITPPRVAMPYTWPLMASRALPLPTAAA